MYERKSERTFRLTEDHALGDISETGASLNLEHEIPGGEVITIEFKTPSMGVSVKAKVIRSFPKSKKRFKSGIHFVELTPDIKAKLKTIVDDYGRGVPIDVSIQKK